MRWNVNAKVLGLRLTRVRAGTEGLRVHSKGRQQGKQGKQGRTKGHKGQALYLVEHLFRWLYL
jgi:hypothetical protein